MTGALLIRSLLAGTLVGAMALPPLAVAPGPADAISGFAARAAGNDGAAAIEETPAPGQIAEWVAASGDNAGLPFLVVDRTYGQSYLFDAAGELQAVAPVATGAARTDDSEPGIAQPGDACPEVEAPPAGRFVVERTRNVRGEEMFRADTSGCIGLPAGFPGNVIDRTLAGGRTVVYVLPDARPAASGFAPAYARVAMGQR